VKKAIEDAVFQGVSLKASDIPVQPRAAGIDSRLADGPRSSAITREPSATEGKNHPHPVAPLPKGEGRICPVITCTFSPLSLRERGRG
jgi:hypothetical protein